MFFVGFNAKVFADDMTSDSYKIQFGNFNMGSGERTEGIYNLSYTMGGTAVGPYGEYGESEYFIGSGFQYVYQIDYFNFSISKLSIELGELFANSFKTDSHTISVTTSGASGYNIYVFENHPLRQITVDAADIADINDTNCNEGCDESTAGLWTDAGQAGFGFNVANVIGEDAASDFVNNNYFRQFANNEAGESMQSIMGSNNVALNSTATVSYKASMLGDQAAGNYQTSVVFVAVPGY